MENEKRITATASWSIVKDPLLWVECPHCKKTIFMSTPTVIERLKKWAKALVKSNPNKETN